VTDVVPLLQVVPAMDGAAIDRVRLLEGAASILEQVNIRTFHAFHAGLYARTVFVPAGVCITGALVKIPTLVTVSGHCLLYVGEGEPPREITGYNVLNAESGRKQVFVALDDLAITMCFATAARTVEEAEAEFTDETDLLLSRRQGGI